ncbi:hypothetical protein [Nonomuraea dietziae]|uniref:hypothetical protein n=1 Tax=Nonomuraea dietziae TaxID=65515 RepID=UPI0031D75475
MLIPVVVKESFPARIGLMTGVYTAALQLGATLGSALTPPLDTALGGWRPALATWAAPAVLALVVWTVAARGGRVRGRPRRPTGGGARSCATGWPGSSPCSSDCRRCCSPSW